MSKRGKKYLNNRSKVNPETRYELEEGIKITRELFSAGFDETLDVAIRLGVDPRHADQMVRGAVLLPHGTGKVVRVAVFAKGEKEKEAIEAGADITGGEDLVNKISQGWLDFDKAIATPDLMGMVAKLGKILGPRGLMPNPKVGTVTFDIARAVKEIKAGKVEFRVEKAGIIHAPVGKVSFEEDKILENIKALMETIIRLKPAGSKGTYLKGITISTTMSPGTRIDPVQVRNLLK